MGNSDSNNDTSSPGAADGGSPVEHLAAQRQGKDADLVNTLGKRKQMSGTTVSVQRLDNDDEDDGGCAVPIRVIPVSSSQSASDVPPRAGEEETVHDKSMAERIKEVIGDVLHQPTAMREYDRACDEQFDADDNGNGKDAAGKGFTERIKTAVSDVLHQPTAMREYDRASDEQFDVNGNGKGNGACAGGAAAKAKAAPEACTRALDMVKACEKASNTKEPAPQP